MADSVGTPDSLATVQAAHISEELASVGHTSAPDSDRTWVQDRVRLAEAVILLTGAFTIAVSGAVALGVSATDILTTPTTTLTGGMTPIRLTTLTMNASARKPIR